MRKRLQRAASATGEAVHGTALHMGADAVANAVLCSLADAAIELLQECARV